MAIELTNICFILHRLLIREDGQDLVEYALVVALIALGATAGMNTVASDISNVFSNLGGTFSSDTRLQ